MSNSKLADAALRAARPNNPALNQALVQAVDACAAAEQAIDERSADAERLTDEACDALTHAAATEEGSIVRRRRRRDEAAAEFRRLVREGSTDTPRLIELARVAGLDEFVRALESGKRVGIKERT